MTLNQLITQLTKLQDKHGPDIEVTVTSDEGGYHLEAWSEFSIRPIVIDGRDDFKNKPKFISIVQELR